MPKYFLILLFFFVNKGSIAQEQPKSNGLIFTFYKKYISSQDGPVCNFSPTCSEYAKQQIKKNGLFIGMFYTADRLCRCHPYSLYQYKYNDKTNKAIDNP